MLARVKRRPFLYAFNAFVFSVLVTLFGLACSKPQPPTIVPKAVRVQGASAAGLELVISVEATNPNSVTLSAQAFSGSAKVDGKYDLGTVTVSKPVSLPPQQATPIEVPLTLPWQDANTLLALAAAQKPSYPYVISGDVTIGGESINVKVPYSMSGTITQQQIAAAAMRSIPQIPGLTIPAPNGAPR